MALTTRSFKLDLYLEHIEEAAFLYEQCIALRRQADFAWRRLEDFEARLEAHLDALVIGGPLALELCERRAHEGEPGEVFAAVSVFCRHQRATEFGRSLRALTEAEQAHRDALAAALARELPPGWVEHCGSALQRHEPALQQTLLDVTALRRLPLSASILTAPLGEHAGCCSAAARALARLRDPASQPLLTKLAGHASPQVRIEALAGLLALGAPEALAQAGTYALQEPRALILLSLAAGPGALDILLTALQQASTSGTAALALGLFGDLRAVRPLLNALRNEVLAAHAAWALYLITGAPLFGEEFVPEPMEADERFSHETHAVQEHGAADDRGDGRPFGTRQRLLSRSVAAWNDWLGANAARFEAGRRYRLGRLAGPASVLETLSEPQLPDSVRQAAAEEARIRYDCDLPFESSLPVRHQVRALRGLARWLEQHQARFNAGRWYFAGRELP
ncbi:TIGR02270 family protein [Niveibacterium umoris]|uniref:Uncharacterized protein (TIGR02270 family) n=1 Tax=Niveibacterium umoris TaxID=1193620 RepID=A0A840BEU2_9RHOO|nr:hypothetical protein [Niveibacterium umoris]MBB4011665.1 uncharacterized protein (TIGR02270 family) [Niveibacterium umoris]